VGPRDREKPSEHLAFAGNTIHQGKRVSPAMDGKDALQEPECPIELLKMVEEARCLPSNYMS
jgi:hypothetical protein